MKNEKKQSLIKQNNDFTILVPTYKGNKHLEENFGQWKTLSKMYNVLFVEDNDVQESKELVKKIGGKYYSKKNNNWGSVINYAIKNNLIKNGYMSIFDVDDVINLNELEKTIQIMKNDKSDIFITKVIKRSVITKKETVKEYRITKKDPAPFIHALFFKAKVFNQIKPTITEGVAHTDEEVKMMLFENAQSFKSINTIPYIHLIDQVEQSINQVNYKSGKVASAFYHIANNMIKNKKSLSNPNSLISFAYLLEYAICNLRPSKILIHEYKKVYNRSELKIWAHPIFIFIKRIFTPKKMCYLTNSN